MLTIDGRRRRSGHSTARLAIDLVAIFAIPKVLGSSKRADKSRFSRIANGECTECRLDHFFRLFRVRLWIWHGSGRVVEDVRVGKEGMRCAGLARVGLGKSGLEKGYTAVKLFRVCQNESALSAR